MFQRFLSLLIAFTLILGMLAGCHAEKPPATTEPQPSDLPATEPSSEPTTEPTEPPVELDFFTRHGQDVPAVNQVPGYAQATDTANLYQLPLELPDAGQIRQILTHGDTLYLLYWLYFDQMPEGCGLVAYSITTGAILYDTELPQWHECGPLDNDGFWVLDLYDMSLEVIDATGQVTTVIEKVDTTGHEYSILDAQISPDGQYLALLFQDGEPVTIYNLSTGISISPKCPDPDQRFYRMQYQQGRFIADDYAGNAYWLDPNTGFYSHCQAAILCDDYRNGLGYGYGTNMITFAGLDGDPEIYYLNLEAGQWLCDQRLGCAALQSYEEGPIVTAVDLRNNLYLAELQFSPNCYNTSAHFMDNGSLLIIATENEANKLYLYDTAAAVPDAKPLDSLLCTQESLAVETAQIAQEVFDACGIEILYGSRGNDFIFSDYMGVAELDPFTVYRAVADTAEILAKYPDGMLREAWHPIYDGLQIYLCGTIRGFYSGGLDAAGGVTSSMDSYAVIAIDISNPIESTLPHELAHVFDHRINSMFDQTDWFSIWLDFHHLDYPYTHDYSHYHDYTAYTPFGEEDPNDVWFVDSYARISATEDRARIMEVLWNSDTEPDPDLEYPHILEKAKLYCYILRQCFPSCNTEEGPFWERHLGTIDESVLP